MNNKKVAILMSTYNGEKYIKEQLDSLLNQSYKNIEIYIRDDGSKDKTINIVKEYENKYNNVIFNQGENVGYINSFFNLLKLCNDADYYAYCDQDDIWMEEKIERAVQKLDENSCDKPILYFSNLDFYDGEMNYLASAPKEKKYNFRNSLVECITQGMTMVINKKARDTIIDNIPSVCLGHDWWTYMICSGFGKIIYDSKSLVKYRRHNKSVTLEGESQFKLLIWRIKKFLLGDSLKQIKVQIKEYDKLYSDKLNNEDRKLLKLFTKDKYNFLIALRKAFYPKRYRRKITDEISVRILFIFGKL